MKDFEEDDLLDGREETLRNLGDHIAKALIRLAKTEPIEEYDIDNSEDYLVGELARCLTLQNLYLDREEYEKCAIMKLRIIVINKKLGLDLTGSMEEPDDEE